jgi:hypothetical protein
MASIKELAASRMECSKTAVEELRASEKEIIAARNESIAAIRAQVADGTLTREEASEQFRTVMTETREALRNNPLRETAKTALEECKEAFLDGIRGLLNAEQLATFEAFLADGTLCEDVQRDARDFRDHDRDSDDNDRKERKRKRRHFRDHDKGGDDRDSDDDNDDDSDDEDDNNDDDNNDDTSNDGRNG